MRARLALLFAVGFAVSANAGPAPIHVSAGEYTQIVLASPKAVALLEIDTRKDGLIEPYVLFPPSELGALHFTGTDEAGHGFDLASARSLPAGTYRVAVSAEKGSRMPFNIALRVIGFSRDAGCGATATAAHAVDAPFTAVVPLRSPADQCWYDVTIPGPGVVLVRLASVNARPGASLSVTQPQASSAPAPVVFGADNSGVARQYFEAKTSGTWRVMATTSTQAALGGDESSFRFDAIFYPDRDLTGTRPGFVALGVSPDDPNIRQLSLRMRAEGKNVIVTNDPREIMGALVAAAKPEPEGFFSGGWGWIVVALVLVALGGAVVVTLRVRKPAAKA